MKTGKKRKARRHHVKILLACVVFAFALASVAPVFRKHEQRARLDATHPHRFSSNKNSDYDASAIQTTISKTTRTTKEEEEEEDKERNAPLLRLDTTTTTTTMRVVASARLSSSLTSARGFVVPERWRLCSRHNATTTTMRTRRRPEKSIIIRAMAKKGSKSSNDEPEGFGFPRYAVRKLARLFALRTTRVLLTSWALLTSR